jgi:hypothetical protein
MVMAGAALAMVTMLIANATARMIFLMVGVLEPIQELDSREKAQKPQKNQ